ncbi:ABC transporter permease [Arthrobacter sp. HY1533]|uniref:ABC transporter permease n=1 Tax=Arthrobacter sp. HY1533 TaxID=2970919 RepID=UPI0022B9DC6F|nr:ABC transporter permease [Arthrobacter sp. HY1533]
MIKPGATPTSLDSPAPLDRQSTTKRRAGARRFIPPAMAVALVFVIWQGVYLSGWRPPYVLPAPLEVVERLIEMLGQEKFWLSLSITMGRAGIGFAVAVAVGTAVGLSVAHSRLLRSAIGSLITGMQTMPSIAWFPFAILIFGLGEQAILFVIVLGAAPSIANGLISGIDEIPRNLLRNAKSMAARGASLYWHIVLPAALPGYVAGLKQGWSFAWRSLMAGELLVIIASRPSLGASLQYSREFSDTPGLMAIMLVILIVGMAVDQVFTRITAGLLHRRGLGAARS